MRSPARDRTPGQQACHQLSSGGFPRAPPPLPIASDTRVKARRPPRTASLHRPERVAGFPAGGRLPPGGQASAQNRVFSAGPAFLGGGKLSHRDNSFVDKTRFL